MAIRTYDEEQFTRILYSHLSPSQPISQVQLLKGRTKTLQQIRQALASPGRHVFIYGDRGVGKTSLAKTASTLYQSSDAEPITLSCAAPFYQLITDLIQTCLVEAPSDARKTTYRAGVSFLGVEHQRSTEAQKPVNIISVNQAVLTLRKALELHSKTPVIVFDEFDLVPGDEDKRLFADFIKQVSDQELNLKMIFTGIGRSISDLLHIHNSTVRYLENIPLERLDFSARLEIITACAEAFGVDVGRDTEIRIAQVSDGFPHYVHLICEKMFWNLFNKEETVTKARAADYVDAIRDAAQSIQAFLIEAYNRATRKYTNDYEEVLWAVADSPLLERSSSLIFQSYKRILEALPEERRSQDERSVAGTWLKSDHRDDSELRKAFNGRINRLKSLAYGQILIGTRAGWYEYRENIVRGYVRLRAEQVGVPLEVDHPLMKTRFPFSMV
ncbi:MAG TPA: ATP-binding protein [Stellaceae bacterium]|nr:ATP-binding protein [Stellaceae bacterium]